MLRSVHSASHHKQNRRRPKILPHADLRRVWLLLVSCRPLAAITVALVIAPDGGPWVIVSAGVFAALCALLAAWWSMRCYHARRMPAFGMLGSTVLGLAATGCALLRLCVETPYPRTASSIFLVAAMFVLTVLQGKLPFLASMSACRRLLPCLLLALLDRLPASCPDPGMQASPLYALYAECPGFDIDLQVWHTLWCTICPPPALKTGCWPPSWPRWLLLGPLPPSTACLFGRSHGSVP